MKKLLITTALASVFSFNVMAADSSHCNSLDKGVQFNKTELSAFDKCWLNTHKADEKSGVSGNVFWMKVGDKFISIPLVELRQAGSKEDRKELIKDTIIQEVIVERIKTITVENGETINRLRAEINTLENITIPGIRSQLQSQIDAKQTEINRLMGLPTFADGQASVTVTMPTGLTVSGEGATRTITVADGYRLVTNADWDAKDIDATYSGFMHPGLTITADGNNIAISLTNGYTLLSDADYAAAQVNYANDRLAEVTLNVSAPDVNNMITITNSANSRSETFEVLNGREIEDGHRTTIVETVGRDNTFTVSGLNPNSGTEVTVLYNRDYIDEQTRNNLSINNAVAQIAIANAFRVDPSTVNAGNISTNTLDVYIQLNVRAQILATAGTRVSNADADENGTLTDNEIRNYVSDNDDRTNHNFHSAPSDGIVNGINYEDPTATDVVVGGTLIAAIVNEANNGNFALNPSNEIVTTFNYTTIDGQTITLNFNNHDNWSTAQQDAAYAAGYRTAAEASVDLALDSVIETAIDNAYQDGYNDGYTDGYTDGYNDGFRDGVASVR